MSYASMMVHVEPDSTSSDSRLDLAVALAARFQAMLIGAAARGIRVPPVDFVGGGILVDEIIAADEEDIRAELRSTEEAFRRRTSAEDITTEWRSTIGVPAEVLATESRAVDLIILGRDLQRLQAGPLRYPDPGEVMMAAGRPVLVVPPGTASLAAHHIVVGWKDTREARRAIWDALPFLKRAEAVHVTEVAPDSELKEAARRAADIVAHLERHQVKASAEVRTRREASAADELILVAEQHAADLIVVGGYGHTRLREWIFGGVTRGLLTRSPMCCLFSH
jgi:nucleotide-binding universal stress UspA family protein